MQTLSPPNGHIVAIYPFGSVDCKIFINSGGNEGTYIFRLLSISHILIANYGSNIELRIIGNTLHNHNILQHKALRHCFRFSRLRIGNASLLRHAGGRSREVAIEQLGRRIGRRPFLSLDGRHRPSGRVGRQMEHQGNLILSPVLAGLRHGGFARGAVGFRERRRVASDPTPAAPFP